MAPRLLRRLLPGREPDPPGSDPAESDPAETAASAGGPLGACDELLAAPADTQPRTPDGCAECLAQGTDWVHLRMCLTCGHVGCCDTGRWRHATAHFRDSGHPVMRSVEVGERWRWCYVHELLG